jgi:hypothetical protein
MTSVAAELFHREHEESLAEQRCRRCGEWIKRGRAVWIDGRPYGRDCAKAVESDNLCGRCGATPSRCTCLKPADNE